MEKNHNVKGIRIVGEQMKKRNPVAKSLRTPKFKQKIVKNKKHYNRKKDFSLTTDINKLHHHFEIYE